MQDFKRFLRASVWQLSFAALVAAAAVFHLAVGQWLHGATEALFALGLAMNATHEWSLRRVLEASRGLCDLQDEHVAVLKTHIELLQGMLNRGATVKVLREKASPRG